MAETVNIAEIAVKLSDEIFKKFKWERIELMDQNFNCEKVQKHSKKESHTHPVDVVFKYFDPYLNKNILLNTDLKSYQKSSITQTKIRNALKSLALTIDCAKISSDWKEKYVMDDDPYEIRALLFTYNHDEDYDKNFYSSFGNMNISTLPLEKNQIIHILEPNSIRYLYAVVKDMNDLYANGKMPNDDYSFYYPDMQLHKVHGQLNNLPATIETLSSPYMIVHFNEVTKFNESSREVEQVAGAGYTIFYNQDGSTDLEFIYLFDTLSRFQILNSKATIQIRVLHQSPATTINSNYKRAITQYVSAWDFDAYKKEQLESIKFDVVTFTTQRFIAENVGWRVNL